MKHSVALLLFVSAAVYGQTAQPSTPAPKPAVVTIPANIATSSPKPAAVVQVQAPGTPITGRNWGSVANPGGAPPAVKKSSSRKNVPAVIYPVYIPVAVEAQAPQTAPVSQGAVVQNYYSAPAQSQQSPSQSEDSLTTYQAPASNAYAEVPEEAAPKAAKYYLIAYKDHHVYTAVTYWVEGQTLHYLTTDEEHNQAPVSSIDTELTKKLNDGRDLGIIGSEQ